jgi:hypothetical protein
VVTDNLPRDIESKDMGKVAKTDALTPNNTGIADKFNYGGKSGR